LAENAVDARVLVVDMMLRLYKLKIDQVYSAVQYILPLGNSHGRIFLEYHKLEHFVEIRSVVALLSMWQWWWKVAWSLLMIILIIWTGMRRMMYVKEVPTLTKFSLFEGLDASGIVIRGYLFLLKQSR
jgi:hypothetical protein